MLINPVERYCMEKGRKEGREDGKLEDARKMIDEGFPIDQIVRITGLPKKIILDKI